jgi:hypothetical protein
MDVGDSFTLEHLLFSERKCKGCREVKNLIEDFYLIRKNRSYQSSYSYECKSCTIQRIKATRSKKYIDNSTYPDW